MGNRGVILSLLVQLKMLFTVPEKQGSPNAWQLPKVLDCDALSACDALLRENFTHVVKSS